MSFTYGNSNFGTYRVTQRLKSLPNEVCSSYEIGTPKDSNQDKKFPWTSWLLQTVYLRLVHT